MRYTEDQVVDALCEAIWECEREPRTNLWLSFWDRLNEGERIPPMPAGEPSEESVASRLSSERRNRSSRWVDFEMAPESRKHRLVYRLIDDGP